MICDNTAKITRPRPEVPLTTNDLTGNATRRHTVSAYLQKVTGLICDRGTVRPETD